MKRTTTIPTIQETIFLSVGAFGGEKPSEVHRFVTFLRAQGYRVHLVGFSGDRRVEDLIRLCDGIATILPEDAAQEELVSLLKSEPGTFFGEGRWYEAASKSDCVSFLGGKGSGGYRLAQLAGLLRARRGGRFIDRQEAMDSLCDLRGMRRCVAERKDRTRPVGDVMAEMEEEWSSPAAERFMRICAAWEKLAGPKLSKGAIPKQFKGMNLVVSVTPLYTNLLRMEARRILAELRNLEGCSGVLRIIPNGVVELTR